jgi:hypothetical protein
MRVRVIVRLMNCGCVKQLVHSTCFEPVHIDAKQGMMAFDVAYRMVDVLLDRIAKADVCQFLAHLAPIPK